ncbi:MAG: hypothetical protein KDC12_01700 [Flavobacteriales bacterium]|nr:hypothetical protein [Flavobacteriales bacterium]
MRILSLLIFLILPGFARASVPLETAMKQAAHDLTLKIQFQGYKKIAVVNFTSHSGEANELGSIVAEEFAFALLDEAFGFEIMDRNHLEAIFEEYRLAMGGLVDEGTLIEIGKLQSVEALVIGTLTRLENSYKATFKVLSTESGSIVAAAKCDFSATPILDSYFGYAGPPTSGIDPPPTLHPLSCGEAHSCIVTIENHRPLPISVRLESEAGVACEGLKQVEVPAGMRVQINNLCSGIIYYRILNSNDNRMLEQGSIYINDCGGKIISVAP